MYRKDTEQFFQIITFCKILQRRDSLEKVLLKYNKKNKFIHMGKMSGKKLNLIWSVIKVPTVFPKIIASCV